MYNVISQKERRANHFAKLKQRKKHLQFLKTVFIQKSGLQQLTVYNAVIQDHQESKKRRFVNESVSCRGGKKHLLGFLCPVWTGNMFMRKFITVHVFET